LRAKQYHDASNLNARAALHERFSTDKANWQRWVFEHLEAPEEARILELGCGPAKLWAENSERIPAGWDIVLTDLSSGMLEEAKRALAETPHAFMFQVVDAQNIPFENATFDAMIANHMLYHVPDLDRALAEIRRVLKPEGKLYAATNGEGHMAELDELLAAIVAAEVGEKNKGQFRLETGERLLAKHFAQVKLHRFRGDLEVTEVEPLLAYITSMARVRIYLESVSKEEADSKLRALRDELEQRLLEDGAIHISKATGLFAAMTA
jgi:ubiquinone/menaquinone biosynthesis C-methylase UbiE